MPPVAGAELSRRAFLGLGLSRRPEPIDGAGAAGRTPGAAAPARPTLATVRARWDAARTAHGEAVWAEVEEGLRALAREVAGGGDHADPVLSVFGPQSTPAARRAIDALFDAAAPRSLVAFSVWTSGAVVQLLKAAADLDPLPPGVPGVWGWGSRERLRQDLDHHADEIHYRRRQLWFAAGSPAAAVDRLAGAVPALAAALERHGDEARARFSPIVSTYAESSERRAPGDTALSVPVPYLLVVARAR